MGNQPVSYGENYQGYGTGYQTTAVATTMNAMDTTTGMMKETESEIEARSSGKVGDMGKEMDGKTVGLVDIKKEFHDTLMKLLM